MRAHWFLIPILLAGCAGHPRTSRAPVGPAASTTAAIPANPATRLVETRYEVRAYHDAADPSVRHDAHAVYRATRVPLGANGKDDALATVPRETFQPASHFPLPQNAELRAELATQKQITSELRTIQTSMSSTQRDAEQKFGELVNQTAETIKLRRDLEEERARVRQLEASLRERSDTTAASAATTVATDMKW
jgi:hypothetical protein